MKKSTTYNNISNHFPDTTLLSLYIVQKQESKEKKLDGSNSKWHRGQYAKLIFFVEMMHVLKDNTNSLTQGPQIVLNKCHSKI